jgi:light-harvesting protein B-800-850 alpha chain
MNNAKMWLVVPPAVGVPVFLGAVAVGSFAVHVAVLSNTSWVSDFLSGQPLGSGDQMAAAEAAKPTEGVARAAYVAPGATGDEITIILPDGSTATAVLQRPDVLASAEASRRYATD